MDVSSWWVGLGIGALAAAAAASAWFRQQRRLAELARRLEESEHSRLELETHAQQVDGQLATIADALARQQAALGSARVVAASGTAPLAPVTAVQALLHHLGDPEPMVIDPQADWIDTEPSADSGDAAQAGPHPAFAETMPAEFIDPTGP